MQSIHITLADAVRGLSSIVDRFGVDHTPTSNEGACTYAVTDGLRLVPVCIVGQYVSDLGILGALRKEPEDEYDSQDVFSSTCAVDAEGFWDRLTEFGVTFDEDAKRFLREVQAQQDAGETWGDALKAGAQDFRRWYANRALGAARKFLAPLDSIPAPDPEDGEQREDPLADWERELLSYGS